MSLPAITARNQLLASLKSDDLALLSSSLRRVELPLMTVLEEPGEPIKNVYFFESGFASVVTGGKPAIEIGLIGREGMSGVSLVMGDDRSSNQTFMQAPAVALQLGAQRLGRALVASSTLRVSLLRYALAFGVQTAHTALANGKARLDVRLARWLLMAHDRFDGDPFPFTHRFIALMLGVRRPGVTDALHVLEGNGLIKASRGRITVVDREGLEAHAGTTYGVPEAEYRRLLRKNSRAENG